MQKVCLFLSEKICILSSYLSTINVLRSKQCGKNSTHLANHFTHRIQNSFPKKGRSKLPTSWIPEGQMPGPVPPLSALPVLRTQRLQVHWVAQASWSFMCFVSNKLLTVIPTIFFFFCQNLLDLLVWFSYLLCFHISISFYYSFTFWKSCSISLSNSH